MFCVIVHFDIKAGFEDRFKEKVLNNAAASLAHEPGCQTFDVCQGADLGQFLLYELYDSEGAFREHLATPHFKGFDRETADWVAGKRVSSYRLLFGVNGTA